jgi:hypothetical protein
VILLAAAEAAANSNAATTQIIIAALSAGGFGAILAAIVTGLFSKKKLGAEATEIITKAAAGVVTNLNDEITRITGTMARMKTEHETELAAERADRARERDEVRRVLQLHVAWDAIAIARLGEIGIDLPPAPPVMPPTRWDNRG